MGGLLAGGSLGQWGRLVRANDALATVTIDQQGTGKLLSLLKAGTEVFSVANNGSPTITVAGLPLTLVNTTDSASIQVLRLEGDRATPTAGDSVYASFYLSNSAGTQIEYGRVLAKALNITNPNETGAIWLQPRIAGGTFADVFRLLGSGLDLNPDAVTFRLYLADPATLRIGATTARSTTEPTNAINLFNGTAPVGTLANGGTIYCAAGEITVKDAGGNATTISPHDDEGYWVFHSTNNEGKVLHVEVEKLLRALNEKFGWDFIKEYAERG